MQYSVLGPSGVKVSRICLGHVLTLSLGRQAAIGHCAASRRIDAGRLVANRGPAGHAGGLSAALP
jgi:aryl-alcohol dehydrogenase-like predicted oxidoreductase